ncbi:hypothetical protein B4146_0153 [Bacillus subtilis]|uniref:Uncharacterized protein n=1 Tax=Bacillus subtilis TaxID=1423 RepID=A0AAP1E263_BACIU|nr:hypothetical protein [Bacillus subtilis]KIN53899.1 hypothetical protein B4146_0153 [Bacillus subtilis]KZD89756.1 hypothetical protein B4122_3646 [Bacillus subtilis]
MAGMFAIILLSPINFIMEKQNKRQACCSLPMDFLPIAVGWSLDESPVQTAF